MTFLGLKTRTNHPMLSETVQKREITSQCVQIETRMSKSSSAQHFDPINFQNGAFFYLDVVRLRATRHSKAEIVNFKKMKFSRPVEYSTPLEYSTQLLLVCQKIPHFLVR